MVLDFSLDVKRGGREKSVRDRVAVQESESSFGHRRFSYTFFLLLLILLHVRAQSKIKIMFGRVSYFLGTYIIFNKQNYVFFWD